MSLSLTLMIVAACLCLAIDATAGAVDSRFSTRHDKDHPWDFTADFANRVGWERRADFLRTQTLVAQGLWPEPPRTPLDAVIHGGTDRDDYTVEKVFFASIPGHYVCGNLYRPKNRIGRMPAVLCPYGHWPNGRFIWKSDDDAKQQIESGAEISMNAARSPLQANCAMLARMGCVVFQYDMVGYCDSSRFEHSSGFTDRQAVMRCQSFMGLQTWNSIRAVDFVLSLPEVDATRVAVAGSSGGGTQAILLSICDPRIAVAFPMVMVSMNMQGGCVCENAPLQRVLTNNVELASICAPKPVGMAAANDWTIDVEWRGLPEMKKIWGLFGAEGEVDGKHFDFGHNHNLRSRELQYNFLNTRLNLGWPAPVKELAFEPIPPEQLSVFDTAHPRPLDETDAVSLRAQMTQVTDRQLRELAATPPDYRRVLRAALVAMMVDDLPPTDDVEVVDGDPRPPRKGSWGGVLSRKGFGERIAFRAEFPNDSADRITIICDPGGCNAVESESARALLSRGGAVLALDLFGAGNFVAPPGASPEPTGRVEPRHSYLGYSQGYERCLIANRVHDVLTMIAFVRGTFPDRRINLLANEGAGIHALFARALAGAAVERAAIDLGGFDFDQITREDDPLILPGAHKYGGVCGVVPLLDGRATLLCNVSENSRMDLVRATKGVQTVKKPVTVEIVQWLCK